MWAKVLLALALLIGPAEAQTYTNNAVMVGAGAGVIGFKTVGPCPNGQVLAWSGGAPACTSTGVGSVTSVGLVMPTALFTVSGSPITSSGTFNVTFVNQPPNQVFAGPPTALPATPGFRSLVGADLPFPSTTTLGGVQAINAISHSWINGINSLGVPQLSQPDFSDLSGTLSNAQCVAPTTSALGCIQAVNPITSNWISSITTSGIPVLTQPSFNDLSGQAALTQLPTIPSNTIISNITPLSATPTANTLTSILDAILGSTQGSVIYRNASIWTVLTPGTQGQVLATSGLNQNPVWLTVSGTGTVTSIQAATGLNATASNPITTAGIIGLAPITSHNLLSNITGGSAAPTDNTLTATIDAAIGSTQGNILFRGPSVWTALAPGTSGQFLMTQGAGASPKWASNATLATTGVSSPTGTTSGAGVMMGLGSTCKITPATTGRVTFNITTNVNTTTAALHSISMNYGTGSAPVNGAANTGTSSGILLAQYVGAAGQYEIASMNAVATGLTVGTQYWFDARLFSGAGTVSMANVSCSAVEN